MKCLIYKVYSKAETILVGDGVGPWGRGLKAPEPEAPAQKGDRLARGPCAPGVTAESLGSRAREHPQWRPRAVPGPAHLGPQRRGPRCWPDSYPWWQKTVPALWPGPGTAGLARPAGSSRPPFSGAVPTLPALSPHVAPAINRGQRPPELYGHRLTGSLLPHAAPHAEDSGRGRSRLQSAGALPGPPSRRLGPHFLHGLPPQALCFWGFFRSPERGAPPPSFQES